VHGDASHVGAVELDLPRVQARADLDAEVADGCYRARGAAHGPDWPVERREEAVAGGVHLSAAEPAEVRPDPRVVRVSERPPLSVAQRGGAFCRSHDVGEQDGREHTVEFRLVVTDLLQEVLDLDKQSLRVTEEEDVVLSGQLDEPGTRDASAVLCTSSIGKVRSPVRPIARVGTWIA